MTQTIRKFASLSTTALLLFMYVAGSAPWRSLDTTAQAHDQKRNQSSRTSTRKISSDLRARRKRNKDAGKDDDKVNVILQLQDNPKGGLNALLKRNGVRVRAEFGNLNSKAVELPDSAIEELASYDEVGFISSDSEISVMGAGKGHVEHTTGADLVRTQTQPNSSQTFTLDGTGIGIAVIDSGIYASHLSFSNESGKSRVVFSKDFTGENRTDDPYGHGTHVASAAVGSSLVAKGKYTGIAPNASVVNLRVLDSQGKGTVSGLLAALDWVMTNGKLYNIRVVNMSLGMPAIDSYKDDPVCRTARRLVDAGFVVLAAAGNNGKDSAGNKIYGQIHSPGIEPSVLTVGASNSLGTDNRADDTIASYSSRGPTRSYWTDTSDVKHYDNLIKPDLAAPGNKMVFAEAINNALVKKDASLEVGPDKPNNSKMMRLSGTSMATPIVAGAAALLLQVNPRLTPNMVKMILMYTAQQLPGFNMFEQGAGEINIEGAVRLAKAIRTDLKADTPVGTPLLTTSAPKPQTSITYNDNNGSRNYSYTNSGTFTFKWSQGIILNQTYATGTNLITRYQGIYGAGVLLGEGVLVSNGVLASNGVLVSNGITLGDNILTSDGITMSEGTYFCNTGLLLGDGVLVNDGVLVGDGVLSGDGVLVGDGVLSGDAILRAKSALLKGDDTDCMD